jgi:predicted transcriptional regulator
MKQILMSDNNMSIISHLQRVGAPLHYRTIAVDLGITENSCLEQVEFLVQCNLAVKTGDYYSSHLGLYQQPNKTKLLYNQVIYSVLTLIDNKKTTPKKLIKYLLDFGIDKDKIDNTIKDLIDSELIVYGKKEIKLTILGKRSIELNRVKDFVKYLIESLNIRPNAIRKRKTITNSEKEILIKGIEELARDAR